MRKRDTVLVLPVLLAAVLLVGWSCSRLPWSSDSRSSGTKGLVAEAPSSVKADIVTAQWTKGAKWVGPPPGAKYAGSDTCATSECHGESAEKYHKTKMGRIMSVNPRTEKERQDCESCHGPGGPHVDSGGEAVETLITFRKGAEPTEVQNATCVNGCHEKGEHTYFVGSTHETRGVACVSCHKVMDPVSDRYNLAKPTVIEVCSQCHLTRRAQLMRSSHMPLREDKMTCSDCHNPHGGVTPAMLREDSVNENCYTCHAEKRGPFLWEHAPVIEGCTNCHEPHGSTNPRLLKVRIPRLCQECHIESRHPTSPYPFPVDSLGNKTQAKQLINRACVNCHQKIHGSNHPSGFAFTN
jgi:DmsE family decaheme c-type cytochrome